LGLRNLARPTSNAADGTTIGLVNWTPEGLIGQMSRVISRYMPAPPDYTAPPPLWGSEEHVADLLDDAPETLSFERGTNPFRFPSIETYMTFFEERYGPTIAMRDRLRSEGTWDACQAELRDLFESLNRATDGSAHLEAEYLVVVGRKR
jgi:hypothetical protein